MRTVIPVLVMLIGLGIGALAVIAGEADDSPGLQGLGVLLAVLSLIAGVRMLRRRKNPQELP